MDCRHHFHQARVSKDEQKTVAKIMLNTDEVVDN